MKVSPAAVIVPLRALVFGLAATLKLTVPVPVPLEPAVIEIHVAESIAAQAQLLDVVTVKDPVPPPAGAAWLWAESE